MKKIIILCVALFATNAIAHTIDWYVDGQIYQTTTCESGDNVTPPTPPTKHGYTFVGWYDENVTIGSWVQTGTPTSDNPIYPTFYQDGNLILRALGRGTNMVADTYNQTTGKITRRVGVKVFTGNENLLIPDISYAKQDAGNAFIVLANLLSQSSLLSLCSHLVSAGNVQIWMSSGFPDMFVFNGQQLHMNIANSSLGITDYTQETTRSLKSKIQAYLSSQYAAGTPVTVYYPLATPIEENYVQ